MKEIIKLGISLLLFCAVAALSLAFTNELTKDKIAEQRAAKELLAKQAVLPKAESFDALDADKFASIKAEDPTIDEISIGKKGGEVVGYVIKTSPQGFGGPVVVITGMNSEGIISGVRIAKHTESPGLGSKAAEPDFYEQYNEKDASKVIVTKKTPADNEIMAISSATITSKAVTVGVNSASNALSLAGE